MNTEEKRLREQRTVDEMIRLYCRKKHGTRGGGLCPACGRLRDYSWKKSEKCPFMEQKTFCSNCKVQCYQPERREEIRQVMRYAGPNMLLYHPGMSISHMVSSRREKRRLGHD